MLALVAVVAAGHLSLFPRVADLDGFYHVGHALAYLEGSIGDTSLPWATRSIIGDTGGDLWWGFHLLLLPFAAFGGVEWGLRTAALALTLTLGLGVRGLLRRHEIQGAGWWAAAFLVAVPNVFYRLLMVRPHVLSLAASLALLSVLVRGRWWLVAVLSAAISWVHLSLFWMGPAIAVTYAVTRVPATVAFGRQDPDRGVPIRAAVPAATLGAIAGWALRPDAVATARLLYVQLVELLALKAVDVPVTFAAELAPIGPLDVLRTSGLFALVWAAALGFLLYGGFAALRASDVPGVVDRLGQERATLVLAAFALSAGFLVIALLSARRALEQWVAFGFLTLPFLWAALGRESREGVPTESRSRMRADGPERPTKAAAGPSDTLGNGTGASDTRPMAPWLKLAAVAALLVHLGWGGWRHSLNVSQVAFPVTTLQEEARFLAERSEPGEVVFHARWDNFGPLLAFNRTNRYLGGMDPIFLFAHDPASFWEFFYLSVDATTEYTCDAYPCAQGVATDTHQALIDHFGARWVVVEPYRNPRLSLFLLDDTRFSLALETQSAAVFEVLPTRPEDGG